MNTTLISNAALIPVGLAAIMLTAFMLSLLALGALTFIDTPYMVQWRKQRLLRVIRGLRLQRLLTRLGIDLDAYAAPLTVQALQQQIQRCQNCAATSRCDHTSGRKQDYSFCPNDKEIRWALRNRSVRIHVAPSLSR